MLLCHWCQSSEPFFEKKNKKGQIEQFPVLGYCLVKDKFVVDGVCIKEKYRLCILQFTKWKINTNWLILLPCRWRHYMSKGHYFTAQLKSNILYVFTLCVATLLFCA